MSLKSQPRNANNWSQIVQKLSLFCKSFMQTSCLFCYSNNIKVSGICQDCYARLPWLEKACNKCAFPLANGASQTCLKCCQASHDIDILQSLFMYQYPMRDMILDFKFHQKLYIGRTLSELLVFNLQPKDDIDYIVPAPLSVQRLKHRGFNQSLEIAKRISKSLAIPVQPKILSKVQDTLCQADLNAKQRQANLCLNDFKVSGSVKAKNILIIDDVYTTGATLKILAKKLKLAGAAYVEAWVICRSL